MPTPLDSPEDGFPLKTCGNDRGGTAGRTEGVLRESILRARPSFLPTRHHTSVVASSTPVISILNAPLCHSEVPLILEGRTEESPSQT